jgi:hypothetical protein
MLEGGKDMKKKLVGIFICTLLILTAISISAKPYNLAIKKENESIANPGDDNKWMKTFGGRSFDLGTYSTETSDGGYIVVGFTSSFGAGSEDVWLLKTDYQGEMEWEKFYGGEYNEEGASVKETSDGGYIISGSTSSYAVGKQDVWLIKTDENGEMLWDKTFGHVEWDHGYKVEETSDGGYIIVGDADHTGGPRGDIWLIKTDSNGNKLWDKKFGGKGHNGGASFDLTSDGGYIIAGSSYVPGETDSYDIWLIKTDENGEKLWDKKFNNDHTDGASDVQETTDGGFIIIGRTGYDHPFSDIWLIKTDSNGEIVWDKVLDGFALDQRGMSIRQTVDGGFIILCEILFNNLFGFCPLIIKTDNEGNQEWFEFIKDYGNDVLFSVEQTSDEGYIFTGYKHSRFSRFRHDLWLIKADSDGNLPTCFNKAQYNYKGFYLLQFLYKILQRILF